MQRAGWVFLLLLFAPALHAFDVEVVRSFKIFEVMHREGKVVFPSERTYQNIRILDRSTYEFVSSCNKDCEQLFADVIPSVVEIRPAKTRAGMWIVQVAFNRAWLITFLVFQKGNEFSIKSPQHFKFLNDQLAAQTRKMILQAVLQENA